MRHRAGAPERALQPPSLLAVKPTTKSSPANPGAAAAIAAATGLAVHHTQPLAPPPGPGRSPPIVTLCALCAPPAGPVPSPGLIALPGTPGVPTAISADTSALLAPRAFRTDCEDLPIPCTGFEAAPVARVAAPAQPRFTLPVLLAATQLRPRAPRDRSPAPVTTSYVSLGELIALADAHASVLAPLVRVATSSRDAPAPVVIADVTPGLLNTQTLTDFDLLDLIAGWARQASIAEIIAIFALGLAPRLRP